MAEAARRMVRGGFRHLIVMGDGMDAAVGILSIRDLVEALLDEREEMAAEGRAPAPAKQEV
ncbi:MAG: CBS domain-containing protein [Actinomycetota bacterium]